MIDFQNAKLNKLSETTPSDLPKDFSKMLVPDETVVAIFKAHRDGVVFTSKRLFVINVQGITGKKVDYTSLPYSKIQAFSIETAGVIDNDAELDLWFSGLGHIRLEFSRSTEISKICRIISEHTL